MLKNRLLICYISSFCHIKDGKAVLLGLQPRRGDLKIKFLDYLSKFAISGPESNGETKSGSIDKLVVRSKLQQVNLEQNKPEEEYRFLDT